MSIDREVPYVEVSPEIFQEIFERSNNSNANVGFKLSDESTLLSFDEPVIICCRGWKVSVR